MPSEEDTAVLFASCQRVIGVKQSMRALRAGQAQSVYLACDADPAVLAPVESACELYGIVPDRSYTLGQLGEFGGISVGAAVIVVLREP